jgi:prophage regulatory protein
MGRTRHSALTSFLQTVEEVFGMEQHHDINLDRVLSLREVEALVGLRKTAIYGSIKENDFPAPIKLTRRKSGWLYVEVQHWLKAKRDERDSASNSPNQLP